MRLQSAQTMVLAQRVTLKANDDRFRQFPSKILIKERNPHSSTDSKIYAHCTMPIYQQTLVHNTILPSAGGATLTGNPVMRYSTARSGLLKLALSAAATRSLSNPIAIMFVTNRSYSSPVTIKFR